jgi:hypothetical protein
VQRRLALATVDAGIGRNDKMSITNFENQNIEWIGAPNPLFKPIGKDMSVEFFAPDDAIYRRMPASE